jgi:hypothetical protein
MLSDVMLSFVMLIVVATTFRQKTKRFMAPCLMAIPTTALLGNYISIAYDIYKRGLSPD